MFVLLVECKPCCYHENEKIQNASHWYILRVMLCSMEFMKYTKVSISGIKVDHFSFFLNSMYIDNEFMQSALNSMHLKQQNAFKTRRKHSDELSYS